MKQYIYMHTMYGYIVNLKQYKGVIYANFGMLFTVLGIARKCYYDQVCSTWHKSAIKSCTNITIMHTVLLKIAATAGLLFRVHMLQQAPGTERTLQTYTSYKNLKI